MAGGLLALLCQPERHPEHAGQAIVDQDLPFANCRDDALLTTDANTALATNVSVPTGSVEASASEGNVWLIGMVRNRFQRDAAERGAGGDRPA